MASATIFSLWYKCLNFIDIIIMQIIVMIPEKNITKQNNHKIESLLWEKYQKP